jgi:YggT family protein
MSDLGLAVLQLGGLITGLIDVYKWIIIISALLSFVNPDPYNPIVQFLYRVTNPAYAFVGRLFRTNFNGVDLAPLVIIVGLQVVVIFINYLVSTIAHML